MDNPVNKYKAFKPINLKDRQWPSKVINQAPTWCSVDLRDGNQALIEPMGSERKDRMFTLLCKLGFKEIEVGFPSASQTDFDFVRSLIEDKKIPSDVNIQVLTQSRNELIERTFESLKGIPRAIVHFYNSTSTLQRKVVFNQDKEGIKEIAINGALKIKELALANPDTDWSFEYSPESFTGTELDYAAEVCDAVVDILKEVSKHKIIINLPATVEMSTPNIYGDQIEWMDKNLKNRKDISLSLHPHNDRGTAVAASLGRSYEAVVRINSQSGKGGVAFLLEKDHGVSLPRRLQISMSQKIQKLADETGKEISSPEIWEIFETNFLKPKNNFAYQSHTSSTKDDVNELEVKMIMNTEEVTVSGTGNGPIDSFVNGLSKELGINIKISDYHQSAISSGSDAQAAAYIELEKDGQTRWGVGINPNTTRASFEAIIVGLSKIL
ncbi:MAG: hypothetical protein EBW26_00715 [Proteobacteria bacterium]|nr:hypothetical protein [Pseudomonadota bacterium]